jgi:O-antigen ligase
MHRWYFLPREANLIVLVGLLALAVGWLTQSALEQAIVKGKIYWPAVVPIAMPFVLLVAMRPVFGAVAAVGFGFVHPALLRPLMNVGPLSLRYFDLVFGLLICIVLARIAVQRRIAISAEFWKLFGPLLLFFLYVGTSLAIVPFSAPDSFPISVSSYMRLILTVSFAPVLHLTLSDSRDVYLFQMGLIVLAVASLALGATLVLAGTGSLVGIRHGGVESVQGRFGGALGIMSFGLVSGLLVLYAFIKRDQKAHSKEWKICLALGLVGLFLAKTASAILAAAAAVTVYLACMRSGRRGGLLRLAAIGTATGVAAALAIWIFRPHDVSGLVDSTGGSFAHRLMISYTGLEIFLDNPLIGVGWQASAENSVIIAPSVSAAAMEAFPGLPTHYFRPSTLHSMYIQFLAELGVIGVVLFAWACFRVGKSVARILGNIPTESPYRVWAQFYALGLMFLLIWWTNQPLYGGQTESVFAMTFLALLANVAQLERERRGQIPGDQYKE